MSHFTVVVIGPDHEGQLAKYDENEPGPERWDPVGDYALQQAEEGLGLEALADPTREHLEQLLLWWKEYDGDNDAYAIENGKLCRKTTYNEHSKWDWYLVGGRWTGFFPLKKGGTGKTGEAGLMTNPAGEGVADQVEKRHIDFEAARNTMRSSAEATWAAWEAATLAHGVPRSWEAIRTSFSDADIDKARRMFHAQGAIGAMRDVVGVMSDPLEYFGTDKQAFIQRQEGRALVPYALVKDGEWYQKGEWRAALVAAEAQEDWNAAVQKLYDEAPDDTLFTLIDCHI